MSYARRRGQALIMISFSILVIFGALGLTVDIGWMHFRREAAQTAADAAAMAAAEAAISSSGTSFSCGSNNVGCQSSTLCSNPLVSSPKNTLDIACSYANSNGFAVTTGGRQSVYVAAGAGTSPPSAPGVTANYWVSVTVVESVPQLFSAVLGNMTGTISAAATGAVTSSGAPTSCIYVLDPSAKAAFSVTGGSTVTSGCGIFVNSTNAQALSVTGGATVTATQAKVVGGYLIQNSTMTPTPTSGAAVTPDPFAGVAAPTYSGCNYTNESIGHGDTVVLSPGVYCNGLTLAGGSHVTLNAGTYIVNGGGINIGGGTVVTGSGVTIYNTSNGYAYAPFNIAGGSSVTLSAPTSGTYRGILFFNDRTLSSTSANVFSGGTLVQLTGSLYFPSTPVSYSGGSASTVTAILAKTVSFSGGSFLAQDITGSKTGLASYAAAMIQ